MTDIIVTFDKHIEAVDPDGDDYRHPWVGYFESLDYETIVSAIL